MVTMRAMLGGAVLSVLACGVAWADWTVVLPEAYAGEEAVRLALEDLQGAGESYGITFTVASEIQQFAGNAIVVGGPDRNAAAHRLLDTRELTLQGVAQPEGYEVVTLRNDGQVTIVIAGGSVLGDAYGLYWIWDRLRVHGDVRDVDTRREPDLDIRFSRTIVNDKDDIRRALRYGLNMVFGEDPLALIPWNAEPERSENQTHCAQARELATYAHALHMKYVAFGTDFTYHPSLLEEFGATLDPDDPRFWDAVQAKYQRLFQAVPELDGVCTFTADEQRYWGNYKTFDVLHGGDCDWNLAKRYRTFITKLWEVVVGGNDKLLLAHTWATNMYEQQAQPAVYREIFTDAVPVPLVVPSLQPNDQPDSA
jgi:hypothetical protein